jgi:eukaryotic-like serine/threonine-protein kinase
MKSIEGEPTELSRGASHAEHESEPAAEVAPDKYRAAELLGRGGMGEVVLAHDRRMGREVAIKRLRVDRQDRDTTRRFLREAKIQARLEHPAIVPIHELGRDADGRPYFTMKRLTGTTLAAKLASLKDGDMRPLLRAFVDVALAIDFAHSRGVVHRDLKPANIMLGDFGEVYVLDWGLARVVAERPHGAERATSHRDEATAVPVGLGEPDSGVDDATLFGEGETIAGALLGTPGYMAPEQIQDASAVDGATDSYALGAILFEILAGEPVHPRGEAIASTIAGVDGSPAGRCPDRAVPPELDVLCSRALASEPVARPSARVLAESVQAYLDGDRDAAMRRDLASEEVGAARRALHELRRDDAMRAAARALALDPRSGAAEIVTHLMLAPPDAPPRASSPRSIAPMRSSRETTPGERGSSTWRGTPSCPCWSGMASRTGAT